MKSILIWVSAGVIGAILGTVSALMMAGLLPIGPQLGGRVEVNGWTSDWSIGSETANPYVRARVARHGLLALRKEEAVYFTRTKDDEGQSLQENCTYAVSGGELPAQWWSITLYDSGSRLPMNEDEALSFDATKAVDDTASLKEWSFTVASSRPLESGENWVSSLGGGQFDLMLRLYRPSLSLLSEPEATLRPPSVQRLSCDGDML
ncbi:MAG: DUF1214 domain-containing protein [Pseudomonadota bacterium]